MAETDDVAYWASSNTRTPLPNMLSSRRSPEVKKVFLDKLYEMPTSPDSKERVGFISFHSKELSAHHKLQTSSSSSFGFSAAQQVVICICQGLDLVLSALLLHIVTDL